VSLSDNKQGYTPIEQSFRAWNVYCEAQGPKMPRGEDHVQRQPYGGGVELQDVGSADAHGGFHFRIGPNSNLIRCGVCDAPLRRYELRDTGKSS
jgi:hypothetical protein